MEPKVVLALVLVTISATHAFFLDPFGGYGGYGGGLHGFGGFGGGFGGYGGFPGYGFPAPLIVPQPIHHHTVQPIIQPIIIQPPEEEEPPPEPKVEVHVHGAPHEPPPPEPHPPPPPIQVIHV